MANVLVVDDEEGIRSFLAEALELEGHAATPVDGGEAALRILAERRVDVLVTDLRMPGMDGMTLLRRVSEQHPEVAVIVLTAFGGVETAVEAMKLGAVDFLTKPLRSPEYACEVVARAAARAKARAIGHAAPQAVESALQSEGEESAHWVRDHFVSTLSHELRNSITIILGYQDLLSSDEIGSLNEEQKGLLARSMKCTQELNDLIVTTLNLTRFGASRVPVDVEPIVLSELFQTLAGEIDVPVNRPDLQLAWNAEPGVVIHSDLLKLKMMLRNLVTNALKFTVRGEVRIEARTRDDQVELIVRDTGAGIPAEALPHLFEPFNQAHGSESRRKGGTGLGLYLVRRLVDVLGGSVNVDSEVGRGSEFRLCLPVRLQR